MEDLTTKSNGMSEDLMGRLGIVEVLDGHDCLISITKSELILSDDSPGKFSVTIDIPTGEEFTDLLKELVLKSPFVGHMAQTGLSSAHIRAVIVVPTEEYVVPAPIPVMTGLIMKRGSEGAAMVPLFRLQSYAMMMGMQPQPVYPLPLGLVVAVMEDDEEELSALRERLRGVPSRYGSSKMSPDYIAVLMDPQSAEEGNVQWRI